jgi:hypothetical protein
MGTGSSGAQNETNEFVPQVTTLIMLLGLFFTVGVICLTVIVSGAGDALQTERAGLAAFGAEIDREEALNAEPNSLQGAAGTNTRRAGHLGKCKISVHQARC